MKWIWGLGYSSMVKCILCIHWTLSLIFSTVKKPINFDNAFYLTQYTQDISTHTQNKIINEIFHILFYSVWGLNLGPLHWAITLAFFMFFILRQDFAKSLSFPAWPPICHPLVSASQSARIKDVSINVEINRMKFFMFPLLPKDKLVLNHFEEIIVCTVWHYILVILKHNIVNKLELYEVEVAREKSVSEWFEHFPKLWRMLLNKSKGINL